MLNIIGILSLNIMDINKPLKKYKKIPNEAFRKKNTETISREE